jgi:predicted ferric reductase
MSRAGVDRCWRIAVRVVLTVIAITPVAFAAISPLQKGREFLWVIGGMAGIVGLSLLFVQPFLMPVAFPWLSAGYGTHWHRWIGIAIVAMVALHVGALYAYSPDDVTDALLLVAPTPFSLYGVIGLWCLVLTAVLAATRRKIRLGHRPWRILHSVLAVAIVGTGVIHAIQIEGAMEEYSKLAICLAALAAATAGAIEVNVLAPLRRRKMRAG